MYVCIYIYIYTVIYIHITYTHIKHKAQSDRRVPAEPDGQHPLSRPPPARPPTSLADLKGLPENCGKGTIL